VATSRAIDVAQSGRGGDDIVQSTRHDPIVRLAVYIVNIDCRINTNMAAPSHFLTAAEAAATLGVTRATLYAYASRGQVRSQAVSRRSRERRYYREDIERLKERQAARRDPAVVAARGLHWGGPVLESGITLIHDGRLFYRGRDVAALAATMTAEETAELLWAAGTTERADNTGTIAKANSTSLASRSFEQPCPLSRAQLTAVRVSARDRITRLQAALPIAAASDFSAADLRPPAVRLTGARILRLLTAVLAGANAPLPMHQALQRTWAPKRPAVAEVIRAALVLCADHELNVSTFTARCAASAGASPYDVVSAALATFKGFKHGGAASRVLQLAASSSTLQRARAAIAEHLREGHAVPGFGHPLYPHGDPRGRILLELAESSGNGTAWGSFRHLVRAGRDVLQDAPNLDCGLAAITRTFELPDDAPTVLFAAGRTIGWIAHAIEEYASGELIRPRARYTGAFPANETAATPV
jgi:citrate synthase